MSILPSEEQILLRESTRQFLNSSSYISPRFSYVNEPRVEWSSYAVETR